MRYISLASIRDAAASIRGKGGVVTTGKLAKMIDCEPSIVIRYLTNIDGLRHEIGYAGVWANESLKYRKAVELLRSHDIIMTYDRLAIMTSTTPASAREWCKRHRDELIGLAYMKAPALRKQHVLTRVRWIRKLNGKVSTAEIARLLQRDRTSLAKLLAQHTEVFADL